MSFNLWTAIRSKPEEESSEASGTAAQDVPTSTENKQATSYSNTAANPEGSSVVETLYNLGCIEEGKNGDRDSSTETIVSHSTDDSSIEAEMETFEFMPDDPSNGGLPEQISGEAANPGDYPVVETLNIFPCTEEDTSDDHDSSTDTAISTSTDDSSIEAETEPFHLPTASNDARLREQFSGESQNFGREFCCKFRSSPDDFLNSSVQDVGLINKFDMKPFLFDLITSFMGLLTSILAIGFGAGNIGKCPADFALPYIVLIMGLLGFLIISYTFWKNGEENDSLNEIERIVISWVSWLIFFLWAWETGKLSSLEFSIDATADNYCSHEFYIFTIVMNIISALGFFIAVCLLGADSNTRASSPTLGDNGWIPFDDF